MADDAIDKSDQQDRLNLGIIQMTRTQQSMHGLRYGDYQQYRYYCSRRLRHLRKTLNFQHGIKKYQKKKLTTDHISSSRWLQLPLLSAERSWAHANDVKNDAKLRGTLAPHQRRHVIRKLKKAAAQAQQLEQLTETACDTQTVLEAVAYRGWVCGLLEVERGQDWESAVGHLWRCDRIIRVLSTVGDYQQQSSCALLKNDVEPLLKQALYQYTRVHNATLSEQQQQAISQTQWAGSNDLETQLASLASTAKSSTVSLTVISQVTWRSISQDIPNDTIRHAVQTALSTEDTCTRVINETGGDAGDGQQYVEEGFQEVLRQYDSILSSIQQAIDATQDALQSGGGGDAETTTQLRNIQSLLKGWQLDSQVARTLHVITTAETRFASFLQTSALSSKGGGGEAGSKLSGQLAVMYDVLCILSQQIETVAQSLQSITQSGGDIELILEVCGGQIAASQAARAYYSAHAVMRGGGGAGGEGFTQATALFRAADDKARAASDTLDGLPQNDEVARWVARVSDLQKNIKMYELVASVEEGGGGAGASGGGWLFGGSKQQGGGEAKGEYLAEGMDEWVNFGGKKGACKLIELPLSMVQASPSPLLLDTAFHYIEMPSLQGKVAGLDKQAGTTSFGRWFGWGQ